MSAQRPTKGIPAAYGGACTNCARAKCRCIYRSTNDATCERCYRLKEQCTLQATVRKWNSRQTNTSRIAQLEKKLEELVGLLGDRAQHGLGTPLPSAGSSSLSPGNPMSENNEDDPDVRQVSIGPSSSAERAPPASRPSHGFDPCRVVQDAAPELAACADQLTPEAAEENLSEFRNHSAFSCPFIYLGPGIRSPQLRADSPFLWFNIMAATTKSLPQQRLMNQAIRQHLAQAMVVEDHKSMDLLWGLLVFMSWAHYHQKMKPHLTLMGCLVHSLVYDMVLHRPRAESPKMVFITNTENSCDEPARTSQADSRRAVLGAFLVTSMAAMNHTRIEPLTWTPFLEECLEKLAQQPECLGDTVLVATVRYQLVANQLAQTLQKSNDSTGVIPPAYVDALRLQLQNLGRQVPGELESNENLAAHALHAALLLDETALKSLDPVGSPDLQRHTALTAQLDTIRRFFDMLLGISPARYLGLPLGFWDQTAHFLIALFRLSARVDTAWDRASVQAVVDVSAICDRLAHSFLEAAAVLQRQTGDDGSAQPDDDIFTKCHHWAKLLRERSLAETGIVDRTDDDNHGSNNNDAHMGVGGMGDESVGDAGLLTAGPGPSFAEDVLFRGPPTFNFFHTADGWFTDTFQTSWD